MQDLRYAVRSFRKSPGFTAVVVASLALGIGINTAVFSIIYGALLRPLPYQRPDQLVDILDSSTRESELAKIFASYTDFEEFSRHSHLLKRSPLIRGLDVQARYSPVMDQTRAYLTIPVTVGFFSPLGVNAELGRTFTADDLRDGCTVVLSNKFWRGPLGSDRRIAGEQLSLDGRSCTVVGVMPARFAVYPPEAQIWSLILPNDPRLRSYFGVFIIARLKPGMTIPQASSELTALHRALHAHEVNGEKDFTPLVSRLQDQFTWLAGRNLRTTLLVIFFSVLSVLLIACLNIANLLLGRSLRAAVNSPPGLRWDREYRVCFVNSWSNLPYPLRWAEPWVCSSLSQPHATSYTYNRLNSPPARQFPSIWPPWHLRLEWQASSRCSSPLPPPG